MSGEYRLPYFHGALLNEDADKLLVDNGDFLLQSKCTPNKTNKKLILAVKSGQRTVRIDIHKLQRGYRIFASTKFSPEVSSWAESHGRVYKSNSEQARDVALQSVQLSLEVASHDLTDQPQQGRSFPNIEALIAYYKTNKLECVRAEAILLKRPVPKGKFQLNHSDIKIMKKIGCGAYGTVYKGLLLRNLAPVAIKRIDCYDKTEQGLVDLMKEARVMQLYDHINVVKFFGFIVDRAPYLLVMEYCKDGSVEDKLRTGGKRLSVAARVDMATQISRGLEYLHLKMCIHRDIATRNCLLSGSIVKLADFGMCRATLVYKIDLSKPQNVRWLAPEVWRSGETRFCTDIYAFAITLWELFEIPYTHPYSAWKAYKVKEKVMAGYRLPNPDDMPDAVATLMRKCWDHDPKRRPTAKEVRNELETINKKYNGEEDVRTAIFSHSGIFEESILSPSMSRSTTDREPSSAHRHTFLRKTR